mgnify:CR=1 FL=1
MQKGTAMNKEITLTPEGGRFYRAMAFHYFTVAVMIVPLAVALIMLWKPRRYEKFAPEVSLLRAARNP